MNDRMKVFADEWLTGAATGKKFNARAAAEHAGYSTAGQNPYQRGSKLLRHPEIREYIQKQLDEFSMSATEVLLRFTDLARADLGSAVKKGAHGGLVYDEEAILKELRPYIKSFTIDSNGNPKVEFHDPVQALRDIARIRGMLKDGIEVSGPGGGAVPVAMSVQFVDPDGTQSDLNKERPENAVPQEDFSDIEDA